MIIIRPVCCVNILSVVELWFACRYAPYVHAHVAYKENIHNYQKICRKMLMFSSVVIFQLYNEVQARRGANDITTENQKNGGELDCGLGYHGNGIFAPGHHSKSHPGAITHHYSNGCNYNTNGYSYPVSHQNGYGVSEIGDLLQDYLGQGKEMSRKNNGARHVVSRGKVIFLLYASIGICTSEETRYVDVL